GGVLLCPPGEVPGGRQAEGNEDEGELTEHGSKEWTNIFGPIGRARQTLVSASPGHTHGAGFRRKKSAPAASCRRVECPESRSEHPMRGVRRGPHADGTRARSGPITERAATVSAKSLCEKRMTCIQSLATMPVCSTRPRKPFEAPTHRSRTADYQQSCRSLNRLETNRLRGSSSGC